MQIDYLADHPDVIPTVARWLHDQWSHLSREASVERREARLHADCNWDRIPLAVVALVDEEPVGVARLVEYDMDTRKDLSPWLAWVFVPSQSVSSLSAAPKVALFVTRPISWASSKVSFLSQSLNSQPFCPVLKRCDNLIDVVFVQPESGLF